jgi:Ca2+-binding EF-hand superfamily protein
MSPNSSKANHVASSGGYASRLDVEQTANRGRRISDSAESLPEAALAPDEEASGASAPQAIKIQGRVGSNASMINGSYERMPQGQNQGGRPCWISRAAKPAYIFHTGKRRWVISKRIDDGSRCYAYISDEGGDPSTCKGPWTVCDEKNKWGPDAKITCVAIPGSDDVFVTLRMSVEEEMKKLGIMDPKNLKQLWKRLDFNGNNVVSLAEIDKMVVEMVSGGSWPQWLNNKPALMRAYKKTILVDGDGDDWVEKKEFQALLLNIFWFNKLWLAFDEIDDDDYRRVDCREFIAGMSKIGLKLSSAEGEEEFKKMDHDGGGKVLFVEFCAYIRKRVNPDHDPNFDADINSGENAVKAVRETHGHGATHGHMVVKKNLAQFDELEKTIKEIMSDNKKLHKLWKDLDYNGNNIVSLAEIDKFVIEKYPLLNHKPALMRAYKASMESVKKDDWVEKKEFKILLGMLFYFNKIFWLFDQVDEDHDRRMTLQEFKWCLSAAGVKVSEPKAKLDFDSVDTNKGGFILFDEFCIYFTQKKCPDCMNDFLGV